MPRGKTGNTQRRTVGNRVKERENKTSEILSYHSREWRLLSSWIQCSVVSNVSEEPDVSIFRIEAAGSSETSLSAGLVSPISKHGGTPLKPSVNIYQTTRCYTPEQLTLQMEVAGSVETLVNMYQSIRRHIPQNSNVCVHRRETSSLKRSAAFIQIFQFLPHRKHNESALQRPTS